jgi:hypothetical protein
MAVDERMRISRVLFLKTKPICNPNFHNEDCWDKAGDRQLLLEY